MRCSYLPHQVGRSWLALTGSLLLASVLVLHTSPTPCAAATEAVPAAVSEWLRSSAPQAVSDAAPGGVPASEVSVMEPVRVWDWDDSFLQGEPQGNGVKGSEHWAAAVQVLGQTVGAVHVWTGEALRYSSRVAPEAHQDAPAPAAAASASPRLSAGPLAKEMVLHGEYLADPLLGDALLHALRQQAQVQQPQAGAEGAGMVVHDQVDQSWFVVRDAVVRPVGQSVLAGELPVGVYARIVQERRAAAGPDDIPIWNGWLPGPQLVWVAVVGFGLLAVTAVLVAWRHERKALMDQPAAGAR